MYFQVQRGQVRRWSQSDGSLHDQPRRLLFHLNVYLFSYFCISLRVFVFLHYSTLSATLTRILLLISIITNSSVISWFAVFLSKYIFSLFNTLLGLEIFLARFGSYGLQTFSLNKYLSSEWRQTLIVIFDGVMMGVGSYFDLINSFEAALGPPLPSFALDHTIFPSLF